jgi:MOSC domain-containing protein YiiM
LLEVELIMSSQVSPKQRLFARYIQDLAPGELSWIGLRPMHKADMTVVDSVMAIENLGLEGDHRMAKTPGSGRQVTLISEEYIQQIAHYLSHSTGSNIQVSPELLRRNLVVKNINLTALRYQQFAIGEAIFEAGALCHPCVRMERALGKGAIAAMMGHGGLCLKVVRSGRIELGDAVELIESI